MNVRRIVKRLLGRGGGSLPPYRPAPPDTVRALLSPGYYELSPEEAAKLPPEVLDELNR